MPPSTAISQSADTSSQPPNTDTVVIKLSRHGAPPPTLLPDSLFRWASCVTQPSLWQSPQTLCKDSRSRQIHRCR